MKRCIECNKPIEHAFEFCDEKCLINHIGEDLNEK